MFYALCDCNNFFVSCERVFRPDLEGKPVVVLSGNDGCVISRSNEAKALGIKMGEPWFQIDARDLTAFSSNFSLYGDLSSRVMSLLSQYTPRLEQYSIDEAFLHADHMPVAALKSYYEKVVKLVRKCVGIPISIGLAPTKTLAKIASKYAKQYAGYHGVCIIDTEEKRRIALQTFPVEDVWGIGRQAHKKLASAGVVTALDFAERSPEFAKNLLHKPGLLTWQELNGSDCIDISDRAERQSISQSRTFLHPIVDRVTMEKVLIDFTTYCAEKLRKQKGLCQQMIVYAHTSRFADETQVIHQVITLPFPTNITSELVSYMLAALRRKWRVCPYKKAGVVLTTIVPAGQVQQMLFDERPKERDERLQKAIDHINMQHGKQAVKTAAQLITTNTQLLTKQERLSPCYTTNIQDILVLKC